MLTQTRKTAIIQYFGSRVGNVLLYILALYFSVWSQLYILFLIVLLNAIVSVVYDILIYGLCWLFSLLIFEGPTAKTMNWLRLEKRHCVLKRAVYRTRVLPVIQSLCLFHRCQCCPYLCSLFLCCRCLHQVYRYNRCLLHHWLLAHLLPIFKDMWAISVVCIDWYGVFLIYFFPTSGLIMITFNSILRIEIEFMVFVKLFMIFRCTVTKTFSF